MNVDKIKALIKEGIKTGHSLTLLQAWRMVDEGDMPEALKMDVIKNIGISMKHGNRAQLDAAIRMLEDYEVAAEPKAPATTEDEKPAPKKTVRKKKAKRGKKKKARKKRKA